MKPTNYNANRHLVAAITSLSEALSARMQLRSDSIADALCSINRALDIQPDIRRMIENGNDARDCLGE